MWRTVDGEKHKVRRRRCRADCRVALAMSIVAAGLCFLEGLDEAGEVRLLDADHAPLRQRQRQLRAQPAAELPRQLIAGVGR